MIALHGGDGAPVTKRPPCWVRSLELLDGSGRRAASGSSSRSLAPLRPWPLGLCVEGGRYCLSKLYTDLCWLPGLAPGYEGVLRALCGQDLGMAEAGRGWEPTRRCEKAGEAT